MEKTVVAVNKKWYQSKTLWVNVVAIVIVGVQSLAGTSFVPTQIQVAIMAVLNIILRALTKTNITV